MAPSTPNAAAAAGSPLTLYMVDDLDGLSRNIPASLLEVGLLQVESGSEVFWKGRREDDGLDVGVVLAFHHASHEGNKERVCNRR